MKHALNTDERPGMLMSCDELNQLVHHLKGVEPSQSQHNNN